MTYDGWMSFGGNEVVNSERVRGYAESAGCPMYWLKGDRCIALNGALGDGPYVYGDIVHAPWYDAYDPDVSSRFYGVYGVEVKGVEDSTRRASITEGIDDGGLMGRARRASREVRFRVLLLGYGQDAVDYGMSWLDAVLDPNGCRQTTDDCGTSEMEVMSTCPPFREADLTDEEYQAILDPVLRFMRNTGPISGPFKTGETQNGPFWMYEAEFTLAGGPAVLGVTRRVFDSVESPLTPGVYQDVPYNLAPNGSAEIGAASVVVTTNLAPNPSVEVNATDWTGVATTVSGGSPASYFTQGRTTELAAVGTASFRSRILGNLSTSATGVADLDAYSEAAIPAGSNRRVSMNMWTACLILTGSNPNTIISSLVVSYEFFNGTTSLGAATTFGTAGAGELSGRAYSVAGVAVPGTATKVRVRARARVTWTSSSTGANNSDIRLYADALAVTVP